MAVFSAWPDWAQTDQQGNHGFSLYSYEQCFFFSFGPLLLCFPFPAKHKNYVNLSSETCICLLCLLLELVQPFLYQEILVEMVIRVTPGHWKFRISVCIILEHLKKKYCGIKQSPSLNLQNLSVVQCSVYAYWLGRDVEQYCCEECHYGTASVHFVVQHTITTAQKSVSFSKKELQSCKTDRCNIIPHWI